MCSLRNDAISARRVVLESCPYETCLQGEAARVARESFFAAEEDNMNDLPQDFRAQLPMSFGALHALLSVPVHMLTVSIG